MGEEQSPGRPASKLRAGLLATPFVISAALAGGAATYALSSTFSPPTSATAAIAVIFFVLAVGARALLGPGGARASAIALAPTLVLSFGLVCDAVDQAVVSMDGGCGTPRMMAAASVAFTSFWLTGVAGAVALVLARRKVTPRHAPRPTAAVVATTVLAVLVGAGTYGAATRPTVAQLRDTLELREDLPDPLDCDRAVEGGSQVVGTRAKLAFDCQQGAACHTTLDLGDGLGPRPGPSYYAGRLRLRSDVTGRIWAFETVTERGERGFSLGGLVTNLPGAVSELEASDVRRALGPTLAPPRDVLALALAGLLVVGVFSLAALRARGTVVRVLAGRDGTLDERAQVHLAGDETLDAQASAAGLRPGAVVVLAVDPRASYRSAASVPQTALRAGSRAEHLARYAALVREWQPVAVVVACALALPLVAAAMAGLVF